MKRIEATVYGRVQMVMFRDFVARKARTLGLCGTVENKKDGSVFVIAEGDDAMLAKLIGHLHEGSTFSRVDSVDVRQFPSKGEFSDFQIL